MQTNYLLCLLDEKNYAYLQQKNVNAFNELESLVYEVDRKVDEGEIIENEFVDFSIFNDDGIQGFFDYLTHYFNSLNDTDLIVKLNKILEKLK